MICYELVDKQSSHWNTKGLLEATRTFYVDSQGSDGIVPDPSYGLPAIYSAWSAYYPLLILVDYAVARDSEGLGWEITCKYSSDGLLTDSYFERTMGFSAEALDTTKHMKWEDAGTVVNIPISTVYPMLEYVIAYKRDYNDGYTPTIDRKAIFGCVGQLNDRIFHGFDKETLLFEGAETREEKNELGLVVRATVTYKFLYRKNSHNQVFREARQKTWNEIPLVYDVCVPTQPAPIETYSPTKKPIYPAGEDKVTGEYHKEGDPVLDKDPVIGKSAWDKPYWMDASNAKHYRYESADFGTILGIPIEDGDDAIGDQDED